MNHNLVIMTGLRGYHIYKQTWVPIIDQRIILEHQPSVFDSNAFTGFIFKDDQRIEVGHLPREISKVISDFREDLKVEGRVKNVEAVGAPGGRGLQIPIQVKIKSTDLKKLQLVRRKLKALKGKNKIVIVSCI